ncbi:carcinoembryonic antigen-related cell adhesion molecule 1-like [Scomber scombrus]
MDLFAYKSLLFLSLIGCCVADELLPAGPLEAVLGKNVTIKTLIKDPSYLFITWTFSDGKEANSIASVSESTGLKLNDAYKGRVNVSSINGNLFLKDLKSEDSGDYQIQIIKKDGSTKTEEINLRVLEPVSKPKITSDLTEPIEHNSTVVLTCTATGSFLTFSWLRGATPIEADGKRVIVANKEESSTLTINNVLRSDLVGPIFCTAVNKLETEKSSGFNLTVYYGPEEVTLTPSKSSDVIEAGSNFNMSCAAGSLPPATFVWYRNKVLMENSGPVLTLATIEKLKLGAQKAEYTCAAKNAKTLRAIASTGFSFATMEPISGVSVIVPTEVLMAGNSSANLSCLATSGTVTTRTWLKDGKPLVASSRVVFSADKSSVKIDPVQKEDNAEFTCQLSNAISKFKASHTMTVNYGPDSVMVTGQAEVEVKDPIELSCSSESVPAATFTWKFNGTATGVKTAKYVVEKATYKNTGSYMCVATNAGTGRTMTKNFTVSVKEEGALDVEPEGLSDGAIAGIVIAVLVALGAAIGLIIYCRQKVP